MHSEPSKNILTQIRSYILDTDYSQITKEANEAALAMLPNLSSVDKIPAYVLLEKLTYLETCYRSQLPQKNLTSYSRDLFVQVMQAYWIE